MMEVPNSKDTRAIYNELDDNAKSLMSALLQSYSLLFLAMYQMQSLTNHQEKEKHNEK